MAKRIYVGNLAWDVNTDELFALFQEHGAVARAQVIQDRGRAGRADSGSWKCKTMSDACKAIETLHHTDFRGRPLKVNEAKPRESRPDGAWRTSRIR